MSNGNGQGMSTGAKAGLAVVGLAGVGAAAWIFWPRPAAAAPAAPGTPPGAPAGAPPAPAAAPSSSSSPRPPSGAAAGPLVRVSHLYRFQPGAVITSTLENGKFNMDWDVGPDGTTLTSKGPAYPATAQSQAKAAADRASAMPIPRGQSPAATGGRRPGAPPASTPPQPPMQPQTVLPDGTRKPAPHPAPPAPAAPAAPPAGGGLPSGLGGVLSQVGNIPGASQALSAATQALTGGGGGGVSDALSGLGGMLGGLGGGGD